MALPPRAEIHCISGTSYQRIHGHKERLADGILFWSSPATWRELAAAIELKGGRVEVSVVLGQLQHAAILVERVAAGIQDVAFEPVLAHKKVSIAELRLLGRANVRFRGRNVAIRRVGCGADLAKVLNP